MPRNFRPQLPRPGEVVPCNGLRQGVHALPDGDVPRSEDSRGRGSRPYSPMTRSAASVFTQDLHFSNNAAAAGYKFAVDCRVGVGHFDGEMMW